MNNDKSDDGRPESGQSGHDRSAERRGIIEAANDIFSGGKVFTHYSTGQQRSSKSDASRGYAEAPMKLIADACRYIEETDDLSILNEYCVSSVPGTEPKLMIFCLYESFRYSLFNRGRHDLPLVKYTAQPSGTVSGDTAPQLVESIDAAETFVSCAAAYAGLCRRLSKINEHEYYGRIKKSVEFRSSCIKPTSSAGAGPGVSGRVNSITLLDEARLVEKEIADMRKSIARYQDEAAKADSGIIQGSGRDISDKRYCLKFGHSGMDKDSRP